jgi:hypothetical protein
MKSTTSLLVNIATSPQNQSIDFQPLKPLDTSWAESVPKNGTCSQRLQMLITPENFDRFDMQIHVFSPRQ